MLKVRGLSLQYKKQYVFNKLNFVLTETSCLLLGRNGTGKSTLLKCLAGYDKYDDGHVQNSYGNISYVPDSFYFHPELTLETQFKLIATCRKTDRSVMAEFIEQFNLQPFLSTKFKQLSLGNKRKLALVGGLLGHHSLVILDEPLIGLDIDSVNVFKRVLRELKRQGTTFIISSNQLDELYDVADQFLILNSSGSSKILEKTSDVNALKNELLNNSDFNPG